MAGLTERDVPPQTWTRVEELGLEVWSAGETHSRLTIVGDELVLVGAFAWRVRVNNGTVDVPS